ncbi:hypothetical protein BH23GEM5_BH23GEM5_27040 [soil metagenome]
MPTNNLRAHLQCLPVDPSIEELRAVARRLAIAASKATYPQKSLAAFRRHNTGVPHLDAVLTLTLDHLAEIEARGPLREEATPEGRWVGAEAAAAVLQERVATIKDRLRTQAGRRALGWAWWNGARWLIPESAINPGTRASYMATLPDIEPAAHAALLPDWCER